MASNLTSQENGYSPMSTPGNYPHAAITDIVGNGFFVLDRHWTVSSWNQMAEKIVGISATDIVGGNLWTTFMHTVSKAFFTTYYQSSIHDMPGHFIIYWPKLKAWFDVTTCYFDDSLSVSFRSIHKPENPGLSLSQLKSLNDMYRLATKVTTDCLWEWDFLSERILWIDGGHKRAFGYEIENALIPQRFWEARIHADDKVRVLASVRRFCRDGIADEWEEVYRFKKSNGDYAYVHDRGHLVYNGDRRTSRMIGVTQDITAQKSAELQLLTSEQNLARQLLKNQKEITAAVVIAQEKERADMGKELHDNLNQILGAAKMYIEAAKTDEDNRDILLEKSTGYIIKVIEAIRDISKNLAAPRLNIMGLAESIRILVDDIVRVNPIRIQFRHGGLQLERLNETLQLDIFRIVQEQLGNILKHAKATKADIHLTKQSDGIELVIADNGVGIDITKNNKGVGIINIMSRAELHHGTVSILSNPGEGYVLKVVFSS